jgi:hypothetical protein
VNTADKELLQKYEPTLCFSGETEAGDDYTERFYPIHVEAYLEQCTLWARRRRILRWLFRPHNVTQEWDSEARRRSLDDPDSSMGKARAEALGAERFDRQHFLRFLPLKEPKQEESEMETAQSALLTSGCTAVLALPPLAAAIWAWHTGVIWLAWVAGVIAALMLVVMVYLFLLSRVDDETAEAVPGLLLGFLLLGAVIWARRAGVSWAAWLTGVLSVLMFLGGLMVYFENSLTPGAADFLTMLVGLVTVVIPPLWAATKLGWRWYVAVPAIGWLVVGLLALVALGGEQGLAALLALTSPLRRKASDRAHELSKTLYEGGEGKKNSPYTYYGRVWPDSQASRVVLQYFLFYPFNDWRYHGGFNFHEGDWEAVFVFLERQGDSAKLSPTYVGLSQHHEGAYRSWETTEKWPDREHGPHPVIYVAAGSHANYFTRDDKPMHSLFRPGLGQKVIAGFEKFRGQFLPDVERQKELLTTAVERRVGQQPDSQGAKAATEPKGERTARFDRRAEERPNGRGLIIGPGKPRALAGQTREAWAEPVILSDPTLPGWARFPGLWGLKTLLKDESGPPGPKWEREGHTVEEEDRQALKGCEECRLYWAEPFYWLEKLMKARPEDSAEARVT